jgi:two-component system, chemotaxis family, protein-glutamate methylesterase/glutaminase
MASTSDRLVVIGASAGGVNALRRLASALPPDLGACVLIVLHVGAHESILPELIASDCAWPVSHAVDGETLRVGTIRIAPPDRHLMVADGRLRLTRGPKENFARPAIDPLFRSAALAFGPNVVGVILTGMLDDGTAGLQAVKAGGGIAIVQDPDDADEPSMPASALRGVAVDHCVPLADLPALLARLLARKPEPRTFVMTDSMRNAAHEQGLSLGTGDHFEHLRKIGKPSPLTCPECHGGLWQIDGGSPQRYRCHTGHAYTALTLELAVAQATDDALWNALRALHERATVLGQLADACRDARRDGEAGQLEQAARRVTTQARSLRDLLERTPDNSEST